MSLVGPVGQDIRLHLVLGRSHSLPWPQCRIGVRKRIGKNVRGIKEETGLTLTDTWNSWEMPGGLQTQQPAQATAQLPQPGPSYGSFLAKRASDGTGGRREGKGREIGFELGPLPPPMTGVI